MKGVRPSRPSLPDGSEVSQAMWSLMSLSWAHQPPERPSIGVITNFLALLTGAAVEESGEPSLDEQTSLEIFLGDTSSKTVPSSPPEDTSLEEDVKSLKIDDEVMVDDDGLSENDNGEEGVLPSVDQYIPPIGVVRLWLQKAC